MTNDQRLTISLASIGIELHLDWFQKDQGAKGSLEASERSLGREQGQAKEGKLARGQYLCQPLGFTDLHGFG